MSIVYDGGKLFSIWWDYYRQYFEAKDIYFLCNEEITRKSGLLDGLGCNIVNFTRPIYNLATEEEQVNGLAQVNAFKNQLLDSYDCVIYADIDEIIFHPDGLDKIVNNLSMDFATCTGYEIVQNRDVEGIFDFSKTVANQRSYWYRWNVYDKPTILRKKLDWVCGYHAFAGDLLEKWLGEEPDPPNKIKNLYLLHLHKLDYDLTQKMHIKHETESLPDFKRWWEEAEGNSEIIPLELKTKFTF